MAAAQGRIVDVPPGYYRFANTIHLTCKCHLEGHGATSQPEAALPPAAAPVGSFFVFPAGSPGIIFDAPGAFELQSSTNAQGTTIEGISLVSYIPGTSTLWNTVSSGFYPNWTPSTVYAMGEIVVPPAHIESGVAFLVTGVTGDANSGSVVPDAWRLLAMNAVMAGGTSPPTVTLTDNRSLQYSQHGPINLVIDITTGGTLASTNVRFKWSIDGGGTFTTGVTAAATVALGTTGIIVNFSAGTYSTDNTYTSTSRGDARWYPQPGFWPFSGSAPTYTDNHVTWTMVAAHAFDAHARVTLKRCMAIGFAGHGFSFNSGRSGSLGGDYGNTDCTVMEDLRTFYNGGSHVYTWGTDAAAMVCTGGLAFQNRGFAVNDVAIGARNTWNSVEGEAHEAGSYQGRGHFINCYSEGGNPPPVVYGSNDEDSGGIWSGGSTPQFSGFWAQTWAPGTTYADGSFVVGTTAGQANSGPVFFYTENGGTSGGSEPVWPEGLCSYFSGITTNDNGIVWQAYGSTQPSFGLIDYSSGDVFPKVIANRFGSTTTLLGLGSSLANYSSNSPTYDTSLPFVSFGIIPAITPSTPSPAISELITLNFIPARQTIEFQHMGVGGQASVGPYFCLNGSALGVNAWSSWGTYMNPTVGGTTTYSGPGFSETVTVQSEVQTTDATSNVALGSAITIPSNCVFRIEVEVDAYSSSAAHGAATWKLAMSYKNVAGTVTALKAAVLVSDSDGTNADTPPTGWNATITQSGTSCQVAVTGAAVTNIDWAALVQYRIIT